MKDARRERGGHRVQPGDQNQAVKPGTHCPPNTLSDQPVEVVLARLDKVRSTGQNRWIARCPAHEDRSPSLSIREADDGRALVHCFSGCSVDSVCAAIGLEVRDLFPRTWKPANRCRTPRIPASDALRAIAHEVTIVLVAAEDVAAGRILPAEDRDRLAIAISRIGAAREVVDGR